MFELSDSTVIITNSLKNPKKIRDIRSGRFFFPFIITENNELQGYNNDSLFHMIQFQKDEIINGENCWKLLVVATYGLKKEKRYYWISKASFLPVKSVIEWEEAIGNIIERTTFESLMKNLKTKDLSSDSNFEFKSLSGYSLVKEFDNTDNPTQNKLLKAGTDAPYWKLKTIEGDSVSIADFKGKIIVMDFWYKACIPCYHQMLDIQEVKNEIGREDLVFISINGIDDPVKENLQEFLKNEIWI